MNTETAPAPTPFSFSMQKCPLGNSGRCNGAPYVYKSLRGDLSWNDADGISASGAVGPIHAVSTCYHTSLAGTLVPIMFSNMPKPEQSSHGDQNNNKQKQNTLPSGRPLPMHLPADELANKSEPLSRPKPRSFDKGEIEKQPNKWVGKEGKW